MLLTQVHLKNIRSYIDETINFEKGSTLLIGDIGSGKTTILLAVEFALFGLLKGDISGSTLLRHGSREGSVELSFTLEEMPVTIVRKLKRKNDTVIQDAGSIRIKNALIEGTPIELKSKIIELLGYPQDLLNKNPSIIYRYTVYTPQEDMKSILFETNEERMDILRKIFNIDRYKRIRENALEYARELRNTKKILESKIQDLEALKAAHSEKTLEIEKVAIFEQELAKQFADATSESEKLLARISQLTAEIEELRKLKNSLEICNLTKKSKQSESERLNKDLNMVMFRIKDYDTRLKEFGAEDINESDTQAALDDAEQKLSKITTAKELVLNRLESKEEDLRNIMIDHAAELRARHQALSKQLGGKESVEKSLEEKTARLGTLQIELETQKLTRNNSAAIINQLTDLSTCPVCLQTVDLSHKVKITDREHAQILGAERKIIEAEKRRAELTEEISHHRSALEVLHDCELELAEINHRINTLNEKIEQKQQLEKEIEDLKSKKQKLDSMDVNKLVDLISKNRRILGSFQVRKHMNESLDEKTAQKKDIEEKLGVITTELTALSAKANDLEAGIAKNSEIEKIFIALKTASDTASANAKQAELQLVSVRKDLEVGRREQKRIAEDIQLKEQVKEKIAYTGELNHWLTEHFVNVISTIEKAIMQKIHQEFNELFRKWFDMLLEDENIDVRIDENFTPIIIQNNYETSIENLSGGEKTSVALAYRLALNKAINDFMNNIKTKDIIILDEPTDGFSSEQLDKMREVLNEINIEQLLMVSHEAKMESYVQNIIRINKNEHVSSKVSL